MSRAAVRRWALVGAKVGVSAALLYLLVRHVDGARLAAALARATPWSVAVAVAVIVVQTAVLGLRWRLVMAVLGGAPGVGRTVGLMFVGVFFNQVLPTAFGGDAVRTWRVWRGGLSYNAAINGVLLERITGVVALALIVSAGGLAFAGAIDVAALRILLIAAFPAALAGLAVLVALDRLPGRWRDRPLLRDLARLSADGRAVLLAPAAAAALLALALAGHALAGLAVYALAAGSGVAITPWACIALFSAVVLITLLPVSFAGWGVREAATVVLFGAAGVAPDAALALSVLFGLVMIAAGLPGLALWLAGRGGG